METRASYLIVGLFVVVLFVGAVGYVIWQGGLKLDQAAPERYDIFFDGSVAGLSEGASVSYRGVNVGAVEEIVIDDEDFSRIRVTIAVDRGTPIREDTVASLGFRGLTGSAYLLLTGGTKASPRLEAEAGRPRPVIASRPSAIQQALEEVPNVLTQGELLLQRANQLFSDENQESLSVSLKNLETITTNLAQGTEGVDAMTAEVRTTMESLRETAESIEQLATTLEAETKKLSAQADGTLFRLEEQTAVIGQDASKTLSEVRQTAASITQLSEEMEAMVADNREPVREFTQTGLNEFTAFTAEARDLVANLNRLLTQIERDPALFFFGNQQQGYETRE